MLTLLQVGFFATVALASFRLAAARNCTVPSVPNGSFNTLRAVVAEDDNANDNANDGNILGIHNMFGMRTGFPFPVSFNVPNSSHDTTSSGGDPTPLSPFNSIFGHLSIVSITTPLPLVTIYLDEGTNVTNGTSIMLDCIFEYEAGNMTNFTCLENGSWNPPISAALCRKTCTMSTPPPPVANGYVEDGPNMFMNYSPGSRRAVVCDDGYHLTSGHNYTECQADATWSTPGVCTPV